MNKKLFVPKTASFSGTWRHWCTKRASRFRYIRCTSALISFFRISKHYSIIHGLQYQISYMLLNFQFLKLCELRASILQIQSSTTSVGLAVFTWTHHKRHKCGRSNLKEMILITKLTNYPEIVMSYDYYFNEEFFIFGKANWQSVLVFLFERVKSSKWLNNALAACNTSS